MTDRKIFFPILLALAAILIGHIATRALYPAYASSEKIAATSAPLRATETEYSSKQLYLRHSFSLPNSPISSRLRIVGHDLITVYVNGRKAGSSQTTSGRTCAGLQLEVADLIAAGRNCIAIAVSQTSYRRPPQVVVDGQYQLQDGTQHLLNGASMWRFTTSLGQAGEAWKETDFDDMAWHVMPQRLPISLAATTPPILSIPGRPFSAKWIKPNSALVAQNVLRRSFRLESLPRDGWIELVTASTVRCVLNGNVVYKRNATDKSQGRPTRVIVDVGPLLERGLNRISLHVQQSNSPPWVAAELLTKLNNGDTVSVVTNSEWQCRSGIAQPWEDGPHDGDDWEPVRHAVDNNNVDVDKLPITLATRASTGVGIHVLRQVTLSILSAVVLWSVGLFCNWSLKNWAGFSQRSVRNAHSTVLMALIVVASGAVILGFESNIDDQFVYSFTTLGVLSAMALTAYVVIAVIRRPYRQQQEMKREQLKRGQERRYRIAFYTIFVLAAAFRIGNLYGEPIHHDEVRAYNWTMGVWERGFPSTQVHPDLPVTYCATSELLYFFNAPFALLTDDPRAVIRVPALCWSLATLCLLYFAGGRFVSRDAATLAMFLFAVSPYLVDMASFGRYLSQLQFFALLTTLSFMATIKGSGAINQRAMWLAALSFIGMYLSWEGSALLAPGMILVALIQKRGRLSTIFMKPAVYMAVMIVASVVIGQRTHRTNQQSTRLFVGSGIESLSLEPMWTTEGFAPEYYLKAISWVPNSLPVLLAVAIAVCIAWPDKKRESLRMLLGIALTPIVVMTLFLPLHSQRYTYYLVPLFMLVYADVTCVFCRWLQDVWKNSQDAVVKGIGQATSTCAALIIIVLGSGHILHADELSAWNTPAHEIGALEIPDWTGPLTALSRQIKPGDIIISDLPHHTRHCLGRSPDYWLRTTPVKLAAMGETQPVLRDVRSGAIVITSLPQLKQVFNQGKRVWYLSNPTTSKKLNDPDVVDYVRQNMSVVSEDFKTSLLLYQGVPR